MESNSCPLEGENNLACWTSEGVWILWIEYQRVFDDTQDVTLNLG